MAHIFDFSRSGQPLGQFQFSVALDNLFGSLNGSVVTQQYGRSGFVSDSVTLRDPGTGATFTETYLVGADGGLYPSVGQEIDIPYDADVLALAPASWAPLRDTFGLAILEQTFDQGGFIAFPGIAAPNIRFDLPNGIVDLSDVHPIEPALERTTNEMIADVSAIFARPLADQREVLMGFWSIPGGLAAPEIQLTYTPDPETRLSIGDLFQEPVLGPEPGNPFFGSMAFNGEIFAGEAIEVRLTGRADLFGNALRFASGDLTVSAGAGNDSLSIGLSTNENNDEIRFAPRNILIEAGQGDDEAILVVDGHDSVTLRGGNGDDFLLFGVILKDGDSARRVIDGGAGNDQISGSIASERIVGGDGDDQIDSSFGADFAPVQEGDTILGGAGNDIVVDGEGDDLVLLGSGDDTINLNFGNDTIFGGSGRDTYSVSVGTFFGSTPGSFGSFGPGNDVIVDDGGFFDVLTPGGRLSPGMRRLGQDLELELDGDLVQFVGFYNSPGAWTVRGITAQGPSEAFAPFSFDAAMNLAPSAPNGPAFSLPQGAGTPEDDALSGSGGADRIDLLAGDDYAQGLGGADRLNGGAGDDTLDGGAGADILIGGPGSDYLIVDNLGDRVVEVSGWDGRDTVVSSVDFRLGRSDVEDLILTGDARIGRGNPLDNRIEGNAGDNILDGDRGVDTLVGGDGNDRYIVRSPGDNVIETAGGGVDAITAFRSYALDAHVENLFLQTVTNRDGVAVDGVNGFGNALDNVIVGNDEANVIAGRGGSDTIRGKAGADRFLFDRALGPDNVDSIVDFNTNGPNEGDTLLMDRAIFGGIRRGDLADPLFREGTEALDRNDRFIFDEATGRLWFDNDGVGGAGQLLIAVFGGGASVTADDIVML